MGNKPSVQLEFRFPNESPDQVFEAISKALTDPTMINFSNANEDKEKREFRILYTTPGCKWIDLLKMRVDKADDGVTTVYGVSGSMNVCPSYCGPLRYLCMCYTCFGDFGQNTLHLRQVADTTKLQYEEKLILRKGLAEYPPPK